MKILISGGGIAGLTLAYWLHHHGHAPTVVEAAPHGRIGGYGIDFFGSGYDVASRMGIVDELARRQLPAEAISHVDGSGRTKARLERRLLEKVIRNPYLALMHTTLEDVLIRSVLDKVDLRYGQRIAAVDEHPGAVDVEFADGRAESYDLLIGADGVHSATRELAFGPERSFARHLGYTMASYYVHDSYGLGPVRAHYTEPGRQVVLYGTGQPDTLVALFLYRSEEHGSIPRTERPERLRAAFAGAGWIVPELLAAAPRTDVFMDTLTQISMTTWHRGRIALVGDASGAMTLASAQGASMAMASGFLLAEMLHAHKDHLTAFRRYESLLHPPVTARQQRARAFARSLVPSTRTGVAAQGLVTRLMLRDTFAGVLRRGFGDTTSLLAEPPNG